MANSTYIEAVGRRKTASARVRLTRANNTTVTVNDKELTTYFPYVTLQNMVTSILKSEDAGIENYTITAKVTGGGISSQAEAIRLGIARALLKEDLSRRTILKAKGYLKRDPRAVERKKPGLRKARKRPAWSKR
ncbi:30S ribosomal protein S9 [Candidatus Kaiserbacteria bacterium RIFCSPHIGHO2_02_FULL_49_34]|uniref:30S ribosomal protein S9 n=1 Tax=Candidatus Kaiserbacteria bacterium RIFCSPHIGHO2_02_FULL_49_34 TaxID=1798491 RepID=A0A1F6DI94_9BACT|nr:MAG: 30S ribosomal protein S9 [Candidatus Kaiserbacteria bacterium RIFCSPHIGHO2_02_FULL_49_34]